MTSTTPKLPQSHFVEVVNVYTSDERKDMLPRMIEEAYSRLNHRAFEAASVITSVTTSFALCQSGTTSCALCPSGTDILAVYIITAQVIPRAELEKLQAAQRFGIQQGPRGLS